jgi:hypothetical protein
MLKKMKDPYPIPKQKDHDRIPLSSHFTIVSILGFLISSVFTVSGRFTQWFMWAGENAGNTWGFLFTLFFLMMLIASIISITPKGDF